MAHTEVRPACMPAGAFKRRGDADFETEIARAVRLVPAHVFDPEGAQRIDLATARAARLGSTRARRDGYCNDP
jgi:hypothetical protein